MRKFILFLSVLCMLVIALPVTAQDDMVPFPGEHTECDYDLTGETVTLYHFGDLSGPLGSITGPIVAAYEDATAYLNEYGILCGATVDFVNEDTGGDRERTQATYDRFTSEFDDIHLLYLYASDDAELLFDQLAEDEIPVIISAGSVPGLYGEDGNSPGWIYAMNPLYVDQLGMFCNYVSANPETFVDPVIGYLGWPNAFGQAAFTPESIAYCAEQGVGFVETSELFSPAEPDIIVNVQNLTDAGANILYVNALGPNGPGKVAQAMSDLGIEGEVALAGVNWVMDTVSTGLTSQGAVRAETGLPVIDGMYGSVPYAWWSETSNPAVQFITQQADLNERAAAVRGVTYLGTWGTVDLQVELLIQTINRVGGLENVTGAAVRETLDSINYETMGGVNVANWQNGEIRDASANRIAVMRFLAFDDLNDNGVQDEGEPPAGIATSAEDAFVIPGVGLLYPIIVPVTEFGDVPNLHPAGSDVPAMD